MLSDGSSPQFRDFVSPTLQLPKGGGAIRGIGEKFGANPVTGTGSMSVPIETTPGRAGFGPRLTLSYDSSAGNGPFGFGWSLSLPSITRKTDKGLPRYWDAEESDEFILSQAEDLVPVLIEDSNGDWVGEDAAPRTVDGSSYAVRRYRPRVEGSFARIEQWSNMADRRDRFWRSISKHNVTSWYGRTEESRICDPGDPGRIFSWLICESHDDKGNVIEYRYQEENSEGVDESQTHERNRTSVARKSNRYIKRIRYGNREPYFPTLAEDGAWPSAPDDGQWLFEVVFDYEDGHYEELPLSDRLDAAAQHRFVRASASGSGRRPWSVRPDPFSSHRAGFEVRAYRRCARALIFHHFAELGTEPCLVRSTEFDYDDLDYRQAIELSAELKHTGSTRFGSKIRAVTQSGYVHHTNQPIGPSDVEERGGVRYARYLKKSLPPLEFEYTQAAIQEQVQTVDPADLENLPEGLDGATYQWVDIDAEGVSGILTEQGGAWFYKRNLSPLPVELENGRTLTRVRFAPAERISPLPSFSALATGAQQILDLAGDGQADVVSFDDPVPGFFERTMDRDWQRFKPFTTLPNLPWDDPNLKFVDLTGDGHADILVTEDEVFTWYPSLAEAGFGSARTVLKPLDEEQGPRLVFADGTDSIYLCDMCGDGLSDLVRIRNGSVSVWPNLGYGRFGAKIGMDNAPRFEEPDRFDQTRIRLADIDGTGVTDILYITDDGVDIYFNQSGNRWSDARGIKCLPAIDNATRMTTVDLLGNGTACLVWSSALPAVSRSPMRYVDLMGGLKPHLLTKITNNLGAEVRVRYAPSTKFYRQDEREGRPWITRLHFPVHVVERVETYDHISRNRFITRYAYHHGHFDGREREFRGFGMVEQWDTQQFETLAGLDLAAPAVNVDRASHVPPVLTRTWFHTGVFLGRGRVSDYFAGMLNVSDVGEYYREPAWRDDDLAARGHTLPDTVLPAGLTPDEEYEACRALKGSMLRQEVYALDGTGTAQYPYGHPYGVVEQNFTVRRLQPKADNRHGVFFAHLHETLKYDYERNPSDPRLSHAMTLEVDDYGNQRRSLVAAYGRRPGQSPLESEDRENQERTLVTYVEKDVTNAIDDPDVYPDHYRAPLASERRTYEITGFAPPTDSERFSFDEFSQDDFEALRRLRSVPYETVTDHGIKRRRLIGRLRTLYRKDDLSALLDRNVLEPKALPGESYELAFTPGLIAQVYDRRGRKLIPDPSATLEGGGADEGGYVDLDADEHWWVPSGRVFYSYDANDVDNSVPPAQELGEARAQFFTPRRYVDPFASSAVVDLDAHRLLPQRTVDALGNTIVSEIDYRVLQTRMLTDPNGNRGFAVFDAVGLVVATAVAGKPGEDLGDLPDDFLGAGSASLANPTSATLDAFFAAPEAEASGLLMRATTRIVYDLECYRRMGRTPFAATLAREAHVSDVAPPGAKVQVSFAYSDGFNREIQKKVQADRGPLREGGPTVDRRWIASGWTIFNNKGKPVRQYESFFDDTHDFKFGAAFGVSPVLFYDPVERVIAILHPNGTYEKTLFGAWHQASWDTNDTIALDPRSDDDVESLMGEYFKAQAPGWQTWLERRNVDPGNPPRDTNGRDPDRDAAVRALDHAATPTVVHVDALGRAFLSVADNGKDGAGDDVLYATRVTLDIDGNQRCVSDAKDRIVARYDYHMAGREQDGDERTAGNRIRQAGMDGGERWTLNDVVGNPIRSWDDRGHAFRTVYDRLRRPVEQYVTGEDSDLPDQRVRGRTVLFEKTEYGEELAANVAAALNLRTRIFRLHDGAGIICNSALNTDSNEREAYDFKGNLLRGTRTLANEYVDIVDWSRRQSTDDVFATATTYDALNRPTSLTMPDGSVVRPFYNEANLLSRVRARLPGDSEDTGFIDSIEYNARGQRKLVEYNVQDDHGNRKAVRRQYDYDADNFRLIRLLATRTTDNRILQDVGYTYDPTGNVTHLADDTQQTIHFKGRVVEPHNDYRYDAVYRLTTARGREHDDAAQPWTSYADSGRIRQAHPHDGKAMRRYAERYEYDSVGNLKRLWHGTDGAGPTWQRAYGYDELSLIPEDAAANIKSNRLSRTTISGPNLPTTNEPYTHDIHGNMLSMPQLQTMLWDFNDQLSMTQRQRVSDEDEEGVRRQGECSYYVYDSSGRRARKITHRQNGSRKDERIYLGAFEIYRKYDGSGASVNLERESLHIMDEGKRLALVETKTLDKTNSADRDNNDAVGERVIRYQFDNHLGSVLLELNQKAMPITYEEYYPHGSTSVQARTGSIRAAAKRYRNSGKERDEESGLYYYGARYYASWLGRWISADPAGLVDGPNAFSFTKNSPATKVDATGHQTNEADDDNGDQDAKRARPTVRDIRKYQKSGSAVVAAPNQIGAKRKLGTIVGVVLHVTRGGPAESAIKDVTDESRKKVKASFHTIIDRSGKVTHVIPYERTAFHAGGTFKMLATTKRGVFKEKSYGYVNSHTIGIEIANHGPIVKVGDKLFKLKEKTKDPETGKRKPLDTPILGMELTGKIDADELVDTGVEKTVDVGEGQIRTLRVYNEAITKEQVEALVQELGAISDLGIPLNLIGHRYTNKKSLKPDPPWRPLLQRLKNDGRLENVQIYPDPAEVNESWQSYDAIPTREH